MDGAWHQRFAAYTRGAGSYAYFFSFSAEFFFTATEAEERTPVLSSRAEAADFAAAIEGSAVRAARRRPGVPDVLLVFTAEDFFAVFAFLASAFAIESASQSFLLEPPRVEAFRLLSHAAEPSSPAICLSERLVSTE